MSINEETRHFEDERNSERMVSANSFIVMSFPEPTLYKYSGNLSFRYQNLTTGIKGFSDFSKRANYNISWSHRQDPKTSPNSNLSAQVNIRSSSQFFRQSLNQMIQRKKIRFATPWM